MAPGPCDGATRPSTPPIAFGPVRSRRLGWSLGINHVPPKTCTYSCVYCQVGATDRARLERRTFVAPETIVAAVNERLAECRALGRPVDHATFVPDGEPTLDLRLGEAIRGVRALGVPVAVLTNGSLLWRADVRADLAPAECVSIKVDTVDEATWRRVNRPIGNLRLATVLDGMQRFAAEYQGRLLTETMLVAGVNDDDASLGRTAAFIAALGPLRAYVAVPTRPPAEAWVRAPTLEAARGAVARFRALSVPVASLFEEIDVTEDGEPPFVAVGDPEAGLLGIIAVHPMTVAAAHAYLARAGAEPALVEALLRSGRAITIRHRGRTYLRRAPASRH